MGLDVKLRHMYRSGALGSDERWFVGGSLAALRFSALITGCMSGAPATEHLQEAFTSMVYKPSMSSAEARQLLKGMMENLNNIAAPRPADIVYHPHFRLAIMVTAMQPWAQLIPEWHLKVIFYTFLGINTATHAPVDMLQRRICFYTGPTLPPFGQSKEEDILFVPLTESNYHQVLHATTCIPFVSVPCTYISGLGRGLYYDGALSDYHLALKMRDPAWPTLLLSAGCAGDPVLANIWDTFLPWRSLKAEEFEHVSMLCPTRHFAHQLPRGVLPGTTDFFDKEYMAHPEVRIQGWNKAFMMSCASMPDHPLDALIVKFEEACPCLDGPLDYAKVVTTQALQRARQACRRQLPVPSPSWLSLVDLSILWKGTDSAVRGKYMATPGSHECESNGASNSSSSSSSRNSSRGSSDCSSCNDMAQLRCGSKGEYGEGQCAGGGSSGSSGGSSNTSSSSGSSIDGCSSCSSSQCGEGSRAHACSKGAGNCFDIGSDDECRVRVRGECGSVEANPGSDRAGPGSRALADFGGNGLQVETGHCVHDRRDGVAGGDASCKGRLLSSLELHADCTGNEGNHEGTYSNQGWWQLPEFLFTSSKYQKPAQL
eukprot:CAMPEP_0202347594 /NCGR_PEP_ID=MMETSP1126-20121109/5888_1 /ASSEMBLY_ACC=CAM_ASM_000457 /TAXON_ID=3047 /ORGANISM="Dunaliella tertiolecta, Strain CCMP1320" /LENGTH=598 /DNA_ID=CAMNT_0048939165 /DNA_START=210 /DNA_END=2006 /DNA_ORIENTATION=-